MNERRALCMASLSAFCLRAVCRSCLVPSAGCRFPDAGLEGKPRAQLYLPRIRAELRTSSAGEMMLPLPPPA